MRCKVKVLSVNGIPAADGSIVPRDVMQAYIDSEDCQKDLRDHVMLSTLTHRSRNIQAVFPDKPQLSKVIGKDDAMLCVDEKAPAPTHYVDKLYIENDGWLYAEIQILNEDGMDDITIQNLRRLKGLLKQGVKIHSSAVIVGAWQSSDSFIGGKGTDYLRKCVKIKGVDLTLNSSWSMSQIVEIYDDNGERMFSDNEETKEENIKVKAFSDTKILGDYPRTLKIDNHFTILKAKEFSCNSFVTEIPEEQQKQFTVQQVRERLREVKMGPRMYFRRLIISYKQMIKNLGGPQNLKPEDEQILKSLLTNDVLYLLGQISGDVIKSGKQINTILGCSSISKNLRVAAQNMQMVYRMAGIEAGKQGYVSKMRYQKLQAAWTEFSKAVIEEVFGSDSYKNIPEDEAMEE